ncbi:HIT/MYND zinc finger-like protein [Glarea lozoyensis ATCC 20868]|uniref:HIT/MYND zinc finger-like protein n=1 Tax=Glarea lozoyensis (strain ATCC 20868 / MF5171) TaxID=1116229 RepID=S3DDT2_GLAL2|nr:HIT/MYND zinc finger-like protein [Glarea lozoyensis ATCC 20868]EPE24783.1 HIT/MYND zinc finger-like protein [Glarea lozoyensis ATCC 20868]
MPDFTHQMNPSPTTAPRSNSDFADRVCVKCSTPASLTCSGCKSTTTDANRRYCSAACQRDDWDEHKMDCKHAKVKNIQARFFRAAIILENIWEAYREKLFDKLITKIEKKDGSLVLHENDDRWFNSPYDMLEPFPFHLLPEPSDKLAVLNFMACGDTLAYLNDVVELLFRDLSTKIVEVAINDMIPKMTITPVDVRGDIRSPTRRHALWKVTLKNCAGIYALDLTGAQFGHMDAPTIPWDIYRASRIGRAGSPFQRRAFPAITHAVSGWLSDNNTTLWDTIQLPQPMFDKCVAGIVDAVTVGIEERLRIARELDEQSISRTKLSLGNNCSELVQEHAAL